MVKIIIIMLLQLASIDKVNFNSFLKPNLLQQ